MSPTFRYIHRSQERSAHVAHRVQFRINDGRSDLYRNIHHLPVLKEREILRWAKAHFRRTGEWPLLHSGAIHEVPGETWETVNSALVRGQRGLPVGSSLAQLFEEHGLKRNRKRLPAFSLPQILEWADDYHACHADWPDKYSGTIDNSPEETWMSVDGCLQMGYRGLPGGTSLTKFLNEQRGIFQGKSRRPNSIPQSERLRVDEDVTVAIWIRSVTVKAAKRILRTPDE